MLSNFFFISILISSLIFSAYSYNGHLLCLDHQKSLLLQFKNELIFDSSFSTKLVRWNETHDCCNWNGVDCDSAGHVISLQLDDESISGGIGDSSILFRLGNLEKLNLAYNFFNHSTPIPKGIHRLNYLTHLNLSNAGFVGQVPIEISSLRRLVSLDISISRFLYPVLIDNLEVLVRNLTGLRELRLDYVNIASSYERTKWSQIVSSYLPHLTTLSLRRCSLSGPLAKSFWQLHSLSTLVLDYNDLSAVVLDLFSNFQNLTFLSLAGCGFSGKIPHSLFGLSKIVEFDLGYNQLEGPIPDSLFRLQSLEVLWLSGNLFSGTFQLKKIRSLGNLTKLNLSDNNLRVDVSIDNSISYGFPKLEWLSLSNNGIGGEIPSWIWGLTQLERLNLSHNLLTGLQKPCHIPSSLSWLDLSSNQLRGELSLLFPPNMTSPRDYLLLANNSFTGSIPTSLCSFTYLGVLDLSVNKLSGSIPCCLIAMSDHLFAIHVGRNNLSGPIPDTFSTACTLEHFDVTDNTLQGKLPSTLKNCKQLTYMNVGNNSINDTFPCMLPSSLRVLSLQSNRFHGEVTSCHNISWPDLQILDISSNHFGGSLESINFSSWKGMVQGSDSQLRHQKFYKSNYILGYGMTLMMKGLKVELSKIWSDFSTIDLSCNNFKGKIPNAIAELTLLHHLNLSHNALNGSIPKSFGKLGNLESLDLSRNQLSGAIPMELGGLTFLSVLNLSYNMLVGEIPNGRQLLTFSADSFKGNPWLCGFNLNISCSHSIDESDLSHEKVEEKKEIEWEYVSAALGYVVGLGSIVWLLLFCRSFRKKYFDKIEEVVEQMFDARDMRRRRRATARRRAVKNEAVMRRRQ